MLRENLIKNETKCCFQKMIKLHLISFILSCLFFFFVLRDAELIEVLINPPPHTTHTHTLFEIYSLMFH